MFKLLMKKTVSSIKSVISNKYLQREKNYTGSKSTNINILLNRVKLDQKKESRKKILFSLIASASVLTFTRLE